MQLLDKLKCKTCDFRARRTSRAKCWALYGQCGNCAFRDHPESFARSVTKTRTQKRTYSLCPDCGNRVSTLRASLHKGMRKIDASFCFKCNIIQVNSKKYTMRFFQRQDD